MHCDRFFHSCDLRQLRDQLAATQLRQNNPHFARLMQAYERIDARYQQLDSGGEGLNAQLHGILRAQRRTLYERLTSLVWRAREQLCGSCRKGCKDSPWASALLQL